LEQWVERRQGDEPEAVYALSGQGTPGELKMKKATRIGTLAKIRVALMRSPLSISNGGVY
jgi:hypothetical protein